MQIKPKILIFEDDPYLPELYGKAFINAGFDVKIFNHYDKPNLIELATKEKPDIIYCDIIMPDMNGLDAIKLLKENEKTKNIPTVAVSNISGQEIKEKSLKAGALSYCCITDYTPQKLAGMFKLVVTLSRKIIRED